MFGVGAGLVSPVGAPDSDDDDRAPRKNRWAWLLAHVFAPTARRASALFDAGQLELVVGGQWWTPRRRIGSRAQDARAR